MPLGRVRAHQTRYSVSECMSPEFMNQEGDVSSPFFVLMAGQNGMVPVCLLPYVLISAGSFLLGSPVEKGQSDMAELSRPHCSAMTYLLACSGLGFTMPWF